MSVRFKTDIPDDSVSNPFEPNPYQPPLPDEFLEDTVQGYEESLRTHEETINGLRDRVRELEAGYLQGFLKCQQCGEMWHPAGGAEPPELCPECDFEKYRAMWQTEADGLRDRIAALEAENERLKWQLVSLPVAVLLEPPVVFGCHMESADID